MTHLFVTQIILSSNTKSCGGNDITHTTERLHNYNHKSLSAFTDEQMYQRRKDISVYPISNNNNFLQFTHLQFTSTYAVVFLIIFT